MAAAKEKIGFEWGVNVGGGGQELGVTMKKADRFQLLPEKSAFCVLIGGGSQKTVCLTPDVYSTVTTAALTGGGTQTFSVQEFEVVSEAADWDAAEHWKAAVADVDMLVRSVAHLCHAPDAAEPSAREKPQGFAEPADATDMVDIKDGDRCFVPYTALRKYLGTRHVMVQWDTAAADTNGAAVPGVFVKVKNSTPWTFTAGAQATVDVDLEKLSNANVVAELFDDPMASPYQPPATGSPAELKRENLLRMLWHIVLAKAALLVDPHTTPGGRKDTYKAYHKTVIGKIWPHLQPGDQNWIKQQFVATNATKQCPKWLQEWMTRNFKPEIGQQQRQQQCTAAFGEVKADFDQGANANPASVPEGKDKGPSVNGQQIVVMMELRNTQTIPMSAGLKWDTGHLMMKDLATLNKHLQQLYP